jgi:hypothetical protein
MSEIFQFSKKLTIHQKYKKLFLLLKIFRIIFYTKVCNIISNTETSNYEFADPVCLFDLQVLPQFISEEDNRTFIDKIQVPFYKEL